MATITYCDKCRVEVPKHPVTLIAQGSVFRDLPEVGLGFKKWELCDDCGTRIVIDMVKMVGAVE